MNCLRLSGSALPETCSADTVVPRMTNRSSPASITDCGVLLGQLRRQGAGHRDPAGAHLLDPLDHQVGLDRLGVDLLQPPGRLARRAGRRPRRAAARGRRTGSTGPRGRARRARRPARTHSGRRRHHRVHRRRHDGDVEPVGVDLPGHRHLLGVAGTPARHDRDVVERVARRPRLALPISMSMGPSRVASARRVVRCFDGHLDVVRVGLLEPGRGDPHEPARCLQLRDGAGADVEHRLVQTADELVGDGRQRPPERDLPLDALRARSGRHC